MARRLTCGTLKCIICGKPAIYHHGHVIGREKMALGNYIDVKIMAGFCEEHNLTVISDENGCYGTYNNVEHGFVPDILSRHE
jgi:predicted hydrocarbon binding protein